MVGSLSFCSPQPTNNQSYGGMMTPNYGFGGGYPYSGGMMSPNYGFGGGMYGGMMTPNYGFGGGMYPYGGGMMSPMMGSGFGFGSGILPCGSMNVPCNITPEIAGMLREIDLEYVNNKLAGAQTLYNNTSGRYNLDEGQKAQVGEYVNFYQAQADNIQKMPPPTFRALNGYPILPPVKENQENAKTTPQQEAEQPQWSAADINADMLASQLKISINNAGPQQQTSTTVVAPVGTSASDADGVQEEVPKAQ